MTPRIDLLIDQAVDEMIDDGAVSLITEVALISEGYSIRNLQRDLKARMKERD